MAWIIHDPRARRYCVSGYDLVVDGDTVVARRIGVPVATPRESLRVMTVDLDGPDARLEPVWSACRTCSEIGRAGCCGEPWCQRYAGGVDLDMAIAAWLGGEGGCERWGAIFRA